MHLRIPQPPSRRSLGMMQIRQPFLDKDLESTPTELKSGPSCSFPRTVTAHSSPRIADSYQHIAGSAQSTVGHRASQPTARTPNPSPSASWPTRCYSQEFEADDIDRTHLPKQQTRQCVRYSPRRHDGASFFPVWPSPSIAWTASGCLDEMDGGPPFSGPGDCTLL